MDAEYEQKLRGSREDALSINEKIKRNLARYVNCTDQAPNGAKTGRKHQLQFSLAMLRCICMAITKPTGTHYDIYCDIFEQTLAPSIEPEASAQHWSRYLEHARYYYYLMLEKKLFSVTKRIFNYLTRQAAELRSEDDYKLLLVPYCQHLLAQRSATEIEVAKANSAEALTALTKLFNCMLQRNTELNFIYKDFMSEFLQALLPKRNKNIYAFYATLPTAELSDMFNACFKLLAQMRMPQPNDEDVHLDCQRQLDAFTVFLQLDIACNLQTQFALDHLNVCRGLSHLQSDKEIGYIFALLQCFVKIIYAQAKVKNFAKTYEELCRKFSILMEKKCSDSTNQQNCFMDFLIVLNTLLTQVQSHAGSFFKMFWQQMQSVTCFTAHIKLISCCIKLCPNITASNLATWECCKSTRKHTILLFAQLALNAYSMLVSNVTIDKEDKAEEIACNELNTSFTHIIHYTVNVINTMSCIDGTSSTDLKMFYAHFAQLTRDIKTPTQACYVIKLAEVFSKLRHKFTNNEWITWLQRLLKTVIIAKNEQLTQEIQCLYIAALLLRTPQVDYALLCHSVKIFYMVQKNVENGKCILQMYEESQNALKPLLDVQQKNMLYLIEAQNFVKSLKNYTKLQQSLMKYAQNDYVYVLIARVGKLDTKSSERLHDMCKKMRTQMRSNGRLNDIKRLAQLVFAHACTALLQEQIELRKKKFNIQSQHCQEDNLEYLLHQKELATITIASEMPFIKLALEAVHAFEAFFYKADLEHISSDDALIDWEILLDDLTAITQYLQLSGYLEYASQAWRLHYHISKHIYDYNNAYRGLAYFCENCVYLETEISKQPHFNLSQEIDNTLPHLLNSLQNLQTLTKRHQTFVLICLCQLAYYYTHNNNFSYAQMLIDIVQQKHQELPERQGKYDIVLSTIDAVKFRILWKYGGIKSETLQTTKVLQQCLVREIESTLARFQNFVFISSTDETPYLILLYNLVQQIAECTSNRLCDCLLNGLFPSVLRLAFQMGAALRIVQTLTMWIWNNLQMEHIQKAQIKFKLIDSALGVRDVQKSNEEKFAAKKLLALSEPDLNDVMSFHLIPGMETMRKVVQVHLSPVKTQKIALSPTSKSRDLKRFLKSPSQGTNNCKDLPDSMLIQWIYFAVGCLNARLHFLIEDYEQLDDYYESCLAWLQNMRTNTFLWQFFQNIHMLAMQHYANYLRANKQYARAVTCIESSLKQCATLMTNVDTVYHINFSLQLHATRNEMSAKSATSLKSLRRALNFNLSPENTFEKPRAKVKTSCSLTSNTKPNFKVMTNDKSISLIKNNEIIKSVTTTTAAFAQETLTNLSTDLNQCQVIELTDSDDSIEEKPKPPKKLQKHQIALAVKQTKIRKIHSNSIENICKSATPKCTDMLSIRHKQVRNIKSKGAVMKSEGVSQNVLNMSINSIVSDEKAITSNLMENSTAASNDICEENDIVVEKMKALKITSTDVDVATSSKRTYVKAVPVIKQSSGINEETYAEDASAVQTKKRCSKTKTEVNLNSQSSVGRTTRARQRKDANENNENMEPAIVIKRKTVSKINTVMNSPNVGRRRRKT